MRKYPILILEDIKNGTWELAYQIAKGTIHGLTFGIGFFGSMKLIEYLMK
jgi:hypothetical protein